MLVIEKQPNLLLPNPAGQPLEWIIKETAYEVQAGEKALFIFSFNSPGPGADAQTFTLLNQDFSTDSAVPYTYNTFEYDADPEVAAANFANMLRSNYAFKDFSIYIQVAGFPSVYAQRGYTGEIPSSEFVNDISGIVPAIPPTYFAGLNREVLDVGGWFQFWENNDPISPVFYSAFNSDGRLFIDGQQMARQILTVDEPYLLWAGPHFDEGMYKRMYIKFGTFTTLDCETVFNQVYESAPAPIVNAILQHEYQLGFFHYSILYNNPVRWMSKRKDEFSICATSFDFLAIFLQKTTDFPDGDYEIRYNFFGDGVGTGESISTLVGTDDGVYHVPVGPANGIASPGTISISDYWDIVVYARDRFSNLVQYSEPIRVYKKSCNCKGVEAYYLEELGSWRSVAFERVQERAINTQRNEYALPVLYSSSTQGSPNAYQLFTKGGISTEITEAEKEYILLSEVITESNRVEYEQFLTSEKHYLYVFSEPLGFATRRIIVDAGRVTTSTISGATRLSIPFRFNDPLRHR